MSIADKIIQAKADYDAVYDAGYAAGIKEGGSEEEIEMYIIDGYYCCAEHNSIYASVQESTVYTCYSTNHVIPGKTYKVICSPMNPDNLWQNFLFAVYRDHPVELAVDANDKSVGKYVTKVNDTTYLITIPENCEQIHINCTIADGCKMYLDNDYVVGYNDGYIAGANANGGTTVSIISYVGAISGHMRSDFEVGENITDANVTYDDSTFTVYKYSFNKAVYGGKLTIKGIIYDSFQDVAHHAVLLLCDGKVAISQDDIEISPDVDSHMENTYILTLPDFVAVDAVYINDFRNSGEHVLTYSGEIEGEETGKVSKGLLFEFIKTRDVSLAVYCGLSELGTCSDTIIYVPSAAPNGFPVVSIGGESFENEYLLAFSCTGVKRLYLPDTVTSIGKWGIVLASSLKYIKFGRYFAEVGEEQHPDGATLSGVTLDFTGYERTTPPTLADTSFLNGVEQVIVPAAMVDAWKSATNWSRVADKVVGV